MRVERLTRFGVERFLLCPLEQLLARLLVLSSVREARHFVQDIVGDLPRERADEIAVMVSELTTNSVSHAASEFTITIRRSIDEIFSHQIWF